jgi:hypothetical protein
MLSPTRAVRQARLEADAGVQIHLDGYCHTCKQRHALRPYLPDDFTVELWSWYHKHQGHDFEFLSPRRRLPPRFRDRIWQKLGLAPWWLEYRENTNFKIQYDAAVALTLTLGSLASSATFVAGRESVAIDNSSAPRSIDSELTAKITTGTTPTVDTEIRVYTYQALNPDTPTYPDTLTGSNADVTLTSPYTLSGGFVLMGSTGVAATSNISYPIKCLSLAVAYGKEPKRWGVYVTHNTVAALHATGGNHVLVRTPAYITDT